MMDSNAQDLLDALEGARENARSLARAARAGGYPGGGALESRAKELSDKMDQLPPSQQWSGDLAGLVAKATGAEAELVRARKVLADGGESSEALRRAVTAVEQAIEVIGILSGGAESDPGRSK